MKPPDRGAYLLVIELKSDCDITIGRLGRFRFRAGYYFYAGSAMRGLAARIARHKRLLKRRYWHIDYLLSHPAARLVSAEPFPSKVREECEISQAVQQLQGMTVPVKGFGSSDCTRGCPAHLAYITRGDLALLAKEIFKVI